MNHENFFTPPPPRKRIVKALCCACAFALTLGAVQNTHAQGWYSSDFLMFDMSTRSVMQNTFDNHNRVFGSGGASKKKKKAKPQKNPAVYRYAYSAEVSRAFEREFIEALIAQARQNNALNADMEAKIRGMENWDYVRHVREAFQAKGHHPDNIATAMGFWLAVTYGTIHNVEGTSVDTDALQDELEIAMSRDKDLQAKDDAQKQRIAENLLWLSAVQILLLEEAGDNAQARQSVAQLARDNLQGYGIDPDRVKLDSGGLQLQ